MKLNVSEYRWILLNCNLMLGQYKGKQYAVIEPKFSKHRAKLDRLLGSVTFPSIEEWNKLSRELRPRLKESNRRHYEAAVRKLSGISNAKLAALNNKQRIELLDGLLIDVVSRDTEAFNQNRQTVHDYKNQIKILLFGLTLPPEFLERETARVNQFCNRLQSVPRLKEDLENWQNPEFSGHRELCYNLIDTFNAVYHTAIVLKFFTAEEWQTGQAAKGLSTDIRTMAAAYVEGNTVYLNREKIALCDNLAVPALIFHQALHIARQNEDLSAFPVIEKLFESKFTCLAFEQDELYALMPMEVHAYAMDEAIITFLLEKMQIKFIENSCPPALRRLTRQLQEKRKGSVSPSGSHLERPTD